MVKADCCQSKWWESIHACNIWQLLSSFQSGRKGLAKEKSKNRFSNSQGGAVVTAECRWSQCSGSAVGGPFSVR